MTAGLKVLFLLAIVKFVIVIGESKNDCSNIQCVHGGCQNGTCVCEKGWQGTSCEFCGGRVRLSTSSGFITDGPGNYSVDTQCAWLIEPGNPNSTVRLRLEHFATECSWDHLYIYDGDSVFSPLLAAYSGLMLRDSQSYERTPEIEATSGSAFLYFSSDEAYNMTGFNISYSIDGCPQNCSGQGVCIDGVCECNGLWWGNACDIPICPEDCGKGTCNSEGHRCMCPEGFGGLDCSQSQEAGIWIPIDTHDPPSGRASSQAVVHQDEMWVFGGYTFQTSLFQVLRYQFNTNKWEEATTSGGLQPSQRYGHTTILYKNHVYMFGGMLENGTVTNDLWLYSLANASWSLLLHNNTPANCIQEPCFPLAVVGHTANLVDDKMVVIFGHSPVYGYMSTVQEYNFSRDEWKLVETVGAIVRGGYGHTSVYDEYTKRIYVHGGVKSVKASSSALTNDMYSYDPREKSWHLLTSCKAPRYLHSSNIINGMMLVFGGNVHNDTLCNLGAKCYSTDFLAYDILCDTWHDLKFPANLYVDIARFGHTAVVYNRSMYIYAGFNGRMLTDILKYTPGSCSIYSDADSCVQVHHGVKCIWRNSMCHPLPPVSPKTQFDKCPPKPENSDDSSFCEALTSCRSCLHTNYDCVWCDTICSHKNCNGSVSPVTIPGKCDPGYSSKCDRLHNCQACEFLGKCAWEDEKRCGLHNGLNDKTDETISQCSVPCSAHETCETCTSEECIWCGVEKRCVESNAFLPSFPYGRCLAHASKLKKCPAVTCSKMKTCAQCQENPSCGWCDDASGTGVGVCLEGGLKGPMTKSGKGYEVDNRRCPSNQWYFTDCPKCHCNGHSTCLDSSDVCNNCQDFTEGPHCEFCVNGFYGDPGNGGNCTACECNHQGTCHRLTGRCFCTTKGIIGDHCEKCDEENHYYGELKDGGTCFYGLTTNFQFTFNLSKPTDQQYNHINFKQKLENLDIDTDFAITCSLPARFNLTVKIDMQEHKVLDNHPCVTFKTTLPSSVYAASKNTTFYVSVYDLDRRFPRWLQVAFSQLEKFKLFT